MNDEVKKSPRVIVGTVVSNGADKTIAVRIDRQVAHPLYRKYIRRRTRLLAHDENNECNNGDIVAIEECRPLSKRKAWRLTRVIERAAQV